VAVAAPAAAARTDSPIQGSDSALTIRLETVTLGSTIQRDPNIRHFFLSAKMLGQSHTTPEVRKTSPPIRVNHAVEVPVTEGSREQQELMRVMQYGKRETADVSLALEWFDPSASGGGEDPEQLAFGTINLRTLWEGRRDMSHQQVQLVTDDGEVTTLTVSTSVMATLERVMQPRR
jgi:hypothetical protein